MVTNLKGTKDSSEYSVFSSEIDDKAGTSDKRYSRPDVAAIAATALILLTKPVGPSALLGLRDEYRTA